MAADSNSLVVNNHRVITELKEEVCQHDGRLCVGGMTSFWCVDMHV